MALGFRDIEGCFAFRALLSEMLGASFHIPPEHKPVTVHNKVSEARTDGAVTKGKLDGAHKIKPMSPNNIIQNNRNDTNATSNSKNENNNNNSNNGITSCFGVCQGIYEGFLQGSLKGFL